MNDDVLISADLLSGFLSFLDSRGLFFDDAISVDDFSMYHNSVGAVKFKLQSDVKSFSGHINLFLSTGFDQIGFTILIS